MLRGWRDNDRNRIQRPPVNRIDLRQTGGVRPHAEWETVRSILTEGIWEFGLRGAGAVP